MGNLQSTWLITVVILYYSANEALAKFLHYKVNTTFPSFPYWALLEASWYKGWGGCGSDHELIAKFRLKLKKVWKTTRPFRYDLNQIPYDYTVEVTNRFKGLYLIDRVPEELWTEVHDIVQEAVIKTIPKKKKCKKAKWLSEEAL